MVSVEAGLRTPIRNTPRRPRLLCVIAVLLIASCAPSGSIVNASGVRLLVYQNLNGGPAAEDIGTLTFRNGCTWLDEGAGHSPLILWPAGTQFSGTGGLVVGAIEIHEGDHVTLGGGEYSDQSFESGLVGPIPPGCATNEYWLATEIATG